MKQFKPRELSTFLTMFIACAAFLVGAVKIWGVPVAKLWSGLLVVLLMVGCLALAALVVVVVIKKISRWRDR